MTEAAQTAAPQTDPARAGATPSEREPAAQEQRSAEDVAPAENQTAAEELAAVELAAVEAPAAARRPTLGSVPGPISPSDGLAVAGRKAMWLHLDRLLRHEAAMRDPERSDELRKYRVATRRLRAAIRLFRPAFRASDVDPIADGLSEVADAVAIARDLDVRAAGLRDWAAERGADSVGLVEPMLAAWGTERRAAMDRLERQLASRRHARLLARLVDFVERVDRSARLDRPGRIVRDRAGSQVWRAFEKVLEYGPGMRWADTATLHQLRIEAKRLRYSLEFLGDVLGPDRPWLVERLVALQDHLGELNDAIVTGAAVRDFLDQYQARLGPEERAEIAAYLDDRERRARALRRGVGRPWRAIAGVTFARRLARTAIVR